MIETFIVLWALSGLSITLLWLAALNKGLNRKYPKQKQTFFEFFAEDAFTKGFIVIIGAILGPLAYIGGPND